jgi:hypothetical protein
MIYCGAGYEDGGPDGMPVLMDLVGLAAHGTGALGIEAGAAF